jgi:hypothetical protein
MTVTALVLLLARGMLVKQDMREMLALSEVGF